MVRITPFDAQKLEAACRILADTERGLTNSEIGYILSDCRVVDVSPNMTKWKRLFNALAEVQNKHQVGNHLIMFINRALDPVKYSRNKEAFEWRRSELNVVLSFSGFSVREDGKVMSTPVETTLKGARARVGALRSRLEDRNAHPEVFKYCKAELLDENYFHAVLEAIKGVGERIRILSGLTSDGAELVNAAFSVKTPILALNELSTDTELSEQKGFSSNMLVGLFGAIRNPTAHAPKLVWSMTEQDALDIFSIMSFVHRKLDKTKIYEGQNENQG
ncbi:TIGR02391 family protein [Methylicorpusculum oleiharenae]|uniref:TIGR02391 family protein n=1 Tax=Methylicorpusculum oleiharenae TaxID=1338687 RepID=UPI0013597F89|nr:TIGR02391 family protein [Methylicorpusculum oleiharenae]MCD2451026.1 TIGR02391 family protein [Methylicorpusculum oleiharenae]